MRPELGQNLEQYSNIAETKQQKPDKHELEQLESELYSVIGQASRERSSAPRDQRRIFRIQQEKQRVMEQLKKQLANLDDPEARAELQMDDRYVMSRDGKLYSMSEPSGETEVSYGELLTDGDWGINYGLDPNTVPRTIHKRYLVEGAKRQLRNFLDEQIIVDETSSRGTDYKKKHAYHKLAEERESGHEQMGHVAEKMVRNFLEKIVYDYPEVNFEVERADVFQDVEQKIDFIIHRRPRKRGVKVEVDEKPGDQGIQFTTNRSDENINRKRAQLENARRKLSEQDQIDDIVLVSVPLYKFGGVYDEWKDKKKPAGGPDKLWQEDVKKEIFFNVMKGLLSEQEIGIEWTKVSRGNA